MPPAAPRRLILTAPGLSTIVNAIVEARKIFQRIQSYVYYRIAMTIDIMFVVVLASVFFGFQPLTAIMIVALALLDDIPIMTIGYDNVLPSPRPVRWRMHGILVFSSLMGLLAMAQSFGIVLAGMEWMSDPELMAHFALSQSHLQTMLFLQLAAGATCCCSSCAPDARSWSHRSQARPCSWRWSRPRSWPC